MKAYKVYRQHLDGLLDRVEWGNSVGNARAAVHECLNGGAAKTLRRSVSERHLRRYGAFFTGEELGRRTLGPLTQRRALLKRPAYDPNCGGGDLLLRWAERLPVKPDLAATIAHWQKLILGSDLHPEFIEVAKRRLVLLAVSQGARWLAGSRPSIDDLFPGLTVADVLAPELTVPTNATLLMNPPFTHTTAPAECKWATGRVSLAALSFLLCVDRCQAGQRVVAILPDVLRSGSRYESWRTKVQERLNATRIEVVGRFDRHADVDVFILEGVVSDKREQNGISWLHLRHAFSHHSLVSLCNVRVGAVVPHRDPTVGPWVPYLTVGELPAWSKVTSIATHRRFAGPTIRPPFVAVRRTSGPRDPERAIGTIVSGRRRVALENHLIALRPIDGKVKSCERIVANLRDARTRAWLDKRIRCRHLTVKVLRELPFWVKAS